MLKFITIFIIIVFFIKNSYSKDDIFLIDINHIIENTKEHEYILKKIEFLKNKELKKFNYILTEIESKKKQLKAKNILSFEALSNTERDIIKLEDEYYKKTQYVEFMLIKQEEELKFPLIKKIILISQELCKEFNCLLLLEKNSTILYQNKSFKEISSLVIKELAKSKK
jgi:Skp family chaperone for outer membrane proteins